MDLYGCVLICMDMCDVIVYVYVMCVDLCGCVLVYMHNYVEVCLNV